MKYLTISFETGMHPNAIGHRIRKAFIEFLPFFEAMAEEMARHQKEKGDSWKTIPKEDLKQLFIDAVEDIHLFNENTQNQLVDVANFEAMIWIREDTKQ